MLGKPPLGAPWHRRVGAYVRWRHPAAAGSGMSAAEQLDGQTEAAVATRLAGT